MYSIVSSSIDVRGRAVKITAKEDATGKESEVVLSAAFVFQAKNELAEEFAEFMKQKGYDLKTGKS